MVGLEAHRRETAQRALGLLDSGDVAELGGALAVLASLVFGPDKSTISNAWHAVRNLDLAQIVAYIPTRDVQAALDEIRPTIEPLLLELAWAG